MRALLGIALVLLLGAAVAAAGSVGGARVGGAPVFALCAVLAFAIQWLAWLPAFLLRSERFYDLTGSLTYISVSALALWSAPAMDAHRLLLFGCVVVWAVRLGSFLFLRVHQDGGDSRFDRIKHDPLRFLLTWSLQGLWVLVTAGAALAAIGSGSEARLGPLAVAGFTLWLLGFLIEAVADAQKRRFRREQGSEAFISSGLWRFSRHPNYAGEIVLWLGVALAAWPLLAGWQLLTLISPVFVYLLLTRVSGVPLLEKKARQRWGDDPRYRDYVARTPVLFPGFGGG